MASIAQRLLTPETPKSHLLVQYGDGQGYQRGQQRHPSRHARYWNVVRFASHPKSDGACADRAVIRQISGEGKEGPMKTVQIIIDERALFNSRRTRDAGLSTVKKTWYDPGTVRICRRFNVFAAMGAFVLLRKLQDYDTIL